MTHILRIDEMAVRFKDTIDSMDNAGRLRREKSEQKAIADEKRRNTIIENKKKNAVEKIAKKCEEIMKNCEVQDFFDTFDYLSNKKDLRINVENLFYEGSYKNEEPEPGGVSIVGGYGGFWVLRAAPSNQHKLKEYIDIVFDFENGDFNNIEWTNKLTTFWYDDFTTLHTINNPIYRADNTIMELVGIDDDGDVFIEFGNNEVKCKTIMKALDRIEPQIKAFIDYFFEQVEKKVRG